ncbi:MAG: hypothetical protein WBV94_04395 [Blastocatellia bacterium]
MEREKELAKLVNVLRRTSRMALQSEWTGSAQDAARFCVEQYNRVLARLREIDSDVGAVFEPLPADSSLTVAAMACRQLAAYYEDEVGHSSGWGDWAGVWGNAPRGRGADKRAFKEFWNKSARDIEDFGEFIRENIEEWARQYRGKRGNTESSSAESGGAKGSERTTSRIDPDETKPQ